MLLKIQVFSASFVSLGTSNTEFDFPLTALTLLTYMWSMLLFQSRFQIMFPPIPIKKEKKALNSVSSEYYTTSVPWIDSQGESSWGWMSSLLQDKQPQNSVVYNNNHLLFHSQVCGLTLARLGSAGLTWTWVAVGNKSLPHNCGSSHHSSFTRTPFLPSSIYFSPLLMIYPPCLLWLFFSLLRLACKIHVERNVCFYYLLLYL